MKISPPLNQRILIRTKIGLALLLTEWHQGIPNYHSWPCPAVLWKNGSFPGMGRSIRSPGAVFPVVTHYNLLVIGLQ